MNYAITMMNYPLTLNTILERAGRIYPKVEIVSRMPDKSLYRTTYGDVYQRARALGEALQKAGLKRGDRVEAAPEVRKIYQQMFGDRDPVAQPGTATGSPGDYWTTLALVPDILKMSSDILFALLQPGRKLEPRYRELAILRTAIVGDCRFEYSQHLKVSRALGIPEDKLQALKGWATSDKFDQIERAVMAASRGLLNLKRISLGRQLTTLALITGGIAVGFTTTGLIAYEVFWFRGQLANSTASTMLPGSAMLLRAMSNAVPWSTDVRMMGSPIVTFTDLPNATSFTGTRP